VCVGHLLLQFCFIVILLFKDLFADIFNIFVCRMFNPADSHRLTEVLETLTHFRDNAKVIEFLPVHACDTHGKPAHEYETCCCKQQVELATKYRHFFLLTGNIACSTTRRLLHCVCVLPWLQQLVLCLQICPPIQGRPNLC
jgi:hypothetical protein